MTTRKAKYSKDNLAIKNRQKPTVLEKKLQGQLHKSKTLIIISH